MVESRTLWTDRRVVRCWIASIANSFKLFVASRIKEIQTLTKAEKSRHVPGGLNPPDCATRALDNHVMPKEWLEGPLFQIQSPDEWPTNSEVGATVEERREKFLQANHYAEVKSVEFETLQQALESVNMGGDAGSGLVSLLMKAQDESFSEDLKGLRE